MRRIKSNVIIKLPKTEVISRLDNPSMFSNIANKYKFLLLENGIVEGYYESKLHI